VTKVSGRLQGTWNSEKKTEIMYSKWTLG